MRVYQVLNNDGYPASDANIDLAIFNTLHNAREYMDYLHNECDIDISQFKIKEFELTEVI